MTNAAGERFLVFVGSYAEPSEAGIRVFSFHSSSGKLTLLDAAEGLKNPSFLDVDHEGNKLYAIAQTERQGEEPCGAAVAYAFDARTGKLTRLNEEITVARPTCHIEYNAEDRYVVVVSYHGGLVGMLPVLPDGRLGKVADVRRHEGTGPHPTRQDRPHPHSANADPDNRFIYVPDLGTDRIVIYRADCANMKLVPAGEAKAAPGAGPRHMAFHPHRPFAYVINELNSTITAYERDAESGSLKEIHTVSTLPETFKGENTCAEVRITPDGKFVYGSNRGHDSIAVFAVDAQSGRLTPVDVVPSQGKTPRHFTLSPDGRHLLAAHQDTGNLVVFRIDRDTGKLHDTGERAEAAKGVCVKFWRHPMP